MVQRTGWKQLVCTVAVIVGGCLGGDQVVGSHQLALDTDGDHFPDNVDNCVGIWNPGQESANLDSEVNQSVTRYGDACDENAVGDTIIEKSMSERVEDDISIYSSRMDRIMIDTHKYTEANEDYETGVRFCRCSNAGNDEFEERSECEDEDEEHTGLCTLDAFAQYDLLNPARWKRPTTTWLVEDSNEECWNPPCEPAAPVRYSPPGNFFRARGRVQLGLAR